MTYAQLKQLAAFYLHRSDLEDYWDAFTSLAREKISKGARLIVMEKNLQFDFIDTVEPLPKDFIAFKSVRLEGVHGSEPLPVYTKQQLDRLVNRSGGGTPIGFTINGGNIEIGPFTSDQTVQTTYYARPAVLVSNEDTNAVLDAWPSLYLQALIETASQAVQDTETQAVAFREFNNAIGEANESDRIAAMSGEAPQMQGD